MYDQFLYVFGRCFFEGNAVHTGSVYEPCAAPLSDIGPWWQYFETFFFCAHALKGVGKTTLLLSVHFCRIFIAIKWKNSGK